MTRDRRWWLLAFLVAFHSFSAASCCLYMIDVCIKVNSSSSIVAALFKTLLVVVTECYIVYKRRHCHVYQAPLHRNCRQPSRKRVYITEQESRAAARKPRDAACSFRLKFANNIPYKHKTIMKATLQSSKHAGAKHNLTQNQDSKSFKVTCLESVEKQWGNK